MNGSKETKRVKNNTNFFLICRCCFLNKLTTVIKIITGMKKTDMVLVIRSRLKKNPARTSNLYPLSTKDLYKKYIKNKNST